MLGDANKLSAAWRKLIDLLQTTEIDGERLIDIAEYRDRLLRLQGEVMAWKAHQLRLLTEQAQGVDSGVKRMIVKYGGTMLGYRAVVAGGRCAGRGGSAVRGRTRMPRPTTPRPGNIDYMYDIGLMIGGGCTNIQKNIIGERGLDLPREPKAQAAAATGGPEPWSSVSPRNSGMFDDSLRAFLADRLPMERAARIAPNGQRATIRRSVAGPVRARACPASLVPERYGGAGLGVLDAARGGRGAGLRGGAGAVRGQRW